MRRLVLLLTLSACEPSDAAYVEAAKEDLAKGCCSYTPHERCEPCAILDGAKVISSRVEHCCAGAGKLVYLTTEGPNGKASCTFQIMKAGYGAFASNGGGCLDLTPKK